LSILSSPQIPLDSAKSIHRGRPNPAASAGGRPIISEWMGGLPRNQQPALLHLVAGLPALSPAYVARTWSKAGGSCSTAGASYLLTQLVGLGIVAEATGRRTWRLYVPADLAHLRQFGRPLRAGKGDARDLLADDRAPIVLDGITATPLAPMAMPGPVEADWAAMMAAIDAVNDRASQVLAQRGRTAVMDEDGGLS
jgi:hypothetical protein